MAKKTIVNQQFTKRMIVNLKFTKNKMNDTLAGYVTKSHGSWKGCRTTDDVKMKIVLPGRALQGMIVENVLYRTTMVPMREKDGFVAIQVEPVRFEARIETRIWKKTWRVEINFGHKTLVYDPFDEEKSRNDINTFRRILESRVDIKDIAQVVDDFNEAVNVQIANML